MSVECIPSLKHFFTRSALHLVQFCLSVTTASFQVSKKTTSLLSFFLFLRVSHFNCQRMSVILPDSLSRIWRRDFARFLILPEELQLGDPKPNCHTQGLGAPILYKLLIVPPGGQEYKFRLKNPRVLLALVQTLLTFIFHLK